MSQTYAIVDENNKVTGFMVEGIHDNIPDGAVPITEETKCKMLVEECSGRVMYVNNDGFPFYKENEPSEESKITSNRTLRNLELSRTDPLVARHRDEVDGGEHTTLSDAEFKSLIAYRKSLRDWPKMENWPNVGMPEAPEFVKQGTK